MLTLIVISLIFQDAENLADWVSVAPPRIGARVKMPAHPLFREQKIRPVRGRSEIVVRSRSAMDAEGNVNYTFVYYDEKTQPSNRQQANAVLDGAITGAIALVNGELIRQNEIFVDNNRGRDFVYQCEIEDIKLQAKHQLKIRSRIVLVRKRLFSLNYIAEASQFRDEEATAYFDSFELIKTPGDLPPTPRPGRAGQLAERRLKSN